MKNTRHKGKRRTFELDFDKLVSEIFVEFTNDGLPINIRELLSNFKIRVLRRKGDAKDKVSFLSRSIIKSEYLKDYPEFKIEGTFFEGKEEKLIFINTSDPFEIRMHMAFHFALFYLYDNKKIDKDTFDKFVVIKEFIPTVSDIYKLAICILMPKDKLDSKLNAYNVTSIEALKNEVVFNSLIEDFYVSKNDLENRLKLAGGSC